MARAHGARAQMALAFESVYGTAPATGYRTVPFASTTLGSEQPLIASELLGQGRDPLVPIKDAVTADGDVVVPIDVENLGLWLKAAFGAPVTSGTTPKTHTFQSGNWTLPSMAIETSMPEVPRYAMYTGCVCDQLSWQMARSGLLTATARLVAQGESVAATTAAGTPTSLALQRFGHFNGTITRNRSPLGHVISAEVTYSNGLDRIETIRSDGRIQPGQRLFAARARFGIPDQSTNSGDGRRAICRAGGLQMRGRKPKPTVLKLIEGNPGRRPIKGAEPKPPPDVPTCPAHLGPTAKAEWKRLARDLNRVGLLTMVDRAALAVYCQSWGRWVEAERKLQETPPLLKTPSGYVQQSP